MADFGKLNFSVSFNPTSAFPVDARYYYDSYESALAAAQTAEEAGSANTNIFYGMNLVVVEDGAATLYTIQPDKTLKAVGSAPVGDEKSVSVNGGIIALKGFDSAESGAQPRKNASGEIEWIKPDTTTVEGLQAAVEGLEQDVSNLQDDVSENTTLLETLNGTGAGSIDAKVDAKLNEFAQNISDDGTVNTFKELVDYVAEHAPEAADMASDITELQTLVGETSVAAQISAAVANKVDAVPGSRLMTDEEGTKLAGIETGAEANVIDSASSEFTISEERELSVNAIATSKITGLDAALAGKVDAVSGKGLSTEDFTAELKLKLEGLDGSADENVIEIVKLNGSAVSVNPTDKSVDIVLPIAAADTAGVVKSASAENSVSVSSDGIMTVNTINVTKLTQSETDTLVLDGGSAVI